MRPPGGAQSAGRPCRPPWNHPSRPTLFNSRLSVQFLLKGRIYGWLIGLREWGRRGRRPFSGPDPADRLAADALAADLIQRSVPARVSTKRRLRARS